MSQSLTLFDFALSGITLFVIAQFARLSMRSISDQTELEEQSYVEISGKYDWDHFSDWVGGGGDVFYADLLT